MVATTIASCALTWILGKLDSIETEIKSLQVQKQSICSASTFGQLSGASSSSGSTIYSLGRIASGVICFLTVSSSISIVSGWIGSMSNSINSGTMLIDTNTQAPVMLG